MLRKVIYFSATTHDLNSHELSAIIKKSTANNTRDDITGVLMYHEGNVCQFIEGPPEKIEALLGRLQSDPRHRRFTIVVDELQSERSLPGWAMVLGDRSSLDAGDQVDFDALMMIWPEDSDSSRILRVIQSFKSRMQGPVRA